MFKRLKIYIQVRRNEVTTINLLTGERQSMVSILPFSTERSVLARFEPFNETTAATIRLLGIRKRFGQMSVIIQQMEGLQDGLTDIEKRALRDVAEIAGGNKVSIVQDETELSIEAALAFINRERF